MNHNKSQGVVVDFTTNHWDNFMVFYFVGAIAFVVLAYC